MDGGVPAAIAMSSAFRRLVFSDIFYFSGLVAWVSSRTIHKDTMLDAALIAAIGGLCGIVLNKLRCRILVSKEAGWSCGAGFSEIPLPLPTN